MKTMRKIIEINEDLCNGCGECVTSCAEGALKVIDGKARLVSEIYCDGLGACLGCPQGALKITEREAAPFDEHATEQYLKEKGKGAKQETADRYSGCPSSRIQMFGGSPCSEANRPVDHADQIRSTSALSHWPVQIRLVPPTAPFLKGADLLVAADCTPVAYPDFHGELLKDKVIMLGCPKFDDADAYIQKFADIFRTADIRSVTVVVMEVPCCSKLPIIVQRGMAIAGKHIPAEEVVISTRGYVLGRKEVAV
ncbi:MAG: 4Fe-4S binding protein [Nitrospirae bacterium]|nr:4Fe-4S binding protein [Nitrospirota bacterium]